MTKDDEIIYLLQEISRKLDRLPAYPEPSIGDNQSSCSKCGMPFVDSMGLPVTLGYVCPRVDCPCGLGGTLC